MFAPWVSTSAGKCWTCDRLGRQVLMFVAPDGSRACADCLTSGKAKYDAYGQGYQDGSDALDPYPPRDLTDIQLSEYGLGYHDGVFGVERRETR